MNPTKNRGEVRYSGMLSSCYSSSDTSRVIIVANPMISQERVKITYLTDTRNKFRKRNVNQTILHESRSI